ncbi:MAG: ThuA domain-containing protein [Bryobacteraceae bacterium]
MAEKQMGRGAARRVASAAALLALMACAGGTLPGQTPQTPRIPGQNPNGMRVFLWTGLKTHAVGQHDYPQFLADWSKLLTDRGAEVNGALRPPSREDLEKTDVVVIYKGDAGYITGEERAALEAFVNRGGGLVGLHDALCGPDPADFAKFLGGGKKHGEVNFTLEAPVPYTVVDKTHPIMKEMSNFTLLDEAFFKVTFASDPGVQVLATAEIAATPSAGDFRGQQVPQIWIYEHPVADGQTARAFVWMQGHNYGNFSNYQIQRMLLRGIAWAAKKPVDELVDYVAPPRPPRPPRAPATGGQ